MSTNFRPKPCLTICSCLKKNGNNDEVESGIENIGRCSPEKTGLIEQLVKIILFVLIIVIGISMHAGLNDLIGRNYFPAPIHSDCVSE